MEKIKQNSVKFAILKLTEEDKTTGKVYIIGKIVSKCYLKETKELQYPNGHIERIYTVNFPYNDIGTYERTMFSLKPSVGDISFDSEDRVNELFDTYEEAKETLEKEQRIANKISLLRGSIYDPNWKQNKEKVISIMKKYYAICNEYEEAVLEATKDMIVDKQEIQKTKKYK